MKLSYNDATHVYMLDGRRCRSVSAVAKIPDDTYGLDAWRKRQILIGVALQPGLAERAAAHFDDREIMDRIAEEALTAARSHDAANRGTAAHRIAERIDLQELIVDTPQSRAVAAAWEKALAIAGLEIVPELIERVVVYPEQKIAGRFDRFARRKADGRLCVLDIKTGSSAVKYPHSVAVQLALYANAPLLAGLIPRNGGSTEQFEPLPDIDRTVGYVVHMPNDLEVDVVGVDLTAGWWAANLCFDVLDWRSQKHLLLPVTEIPVDGEEPPFQNACIPTVGTDGMLLAKRRDWIADRLKTIATLGPDAKELMARYWPPQTPYRPPWTDDQIDLLDRALQQVEKETEAPFPPTDPTKQPERQPL